jgi:ferredoxin
MLPATRPSPACRETAVPDESDDRKAGPAADAVGLLVRSSHAVSDEGSGATFDVRCGEAILDAALSQGVELAHGCRHGVCGACAVEIVEGLEHVLPADPIESNSIQRFRLRTGVRLACRACVRGPVRIRPA